jgi:hypothetical protein
MVASMSLPGKEAELVAAINSDSRLAQLDCKAFVSSPGGVKIAYRGTQLGLWAFRATMFSFTPEGCSTPIMGATTVNKALDMVVKHIKTID